MLASAESRRKNRVCKAWKSEALRGLFGQIERIKGTKKQIDKIPIVGALLQ